MQRFHSTAQHSREHSPWLLTSDKLHWCTVHLKFNSCLTYRHLNRGSSIPQQIQYLHLCEAEARRSVDEGNVYSPLDLETGGVDVSLAVHAGIPVAVAGMISIPVEHLRRRHTNGA